jgi:hypothetical protein
MKLADFISVTATDDVPDIAEALFQRKYKRGVPDFPHHVVAMFNSAENTSLLACYIHFTDCGDILLGGGACVDNRVLRGMSVEQRDLIHDVGGIYRYALEWSVQHFSTRFDAIFGYCGDALAERIDRAAGFQSTPHDHLLVYWTGESDARRRRQMIAKAHSFGAF